MKYTVLWSPEAEAQLANVWLDATDRDAIQRTADTIDDRLEMNPYQLSESREGSLRIAIYFPLGIEYEVIEDDKEVVVLGVWVPRTRGTR